MTTDLRPSVLQRTLRRVLDDGRYRAAVRTDPWAAQRASGLSDAEWDQVRAVAEMLDAEADWTDADPSYRIADTPRVG